jgi:hypothetical protein
VPAPTGNQLTNWNETNSLESTEFYTP